MAFGSARASDTACSSDSEGVSELEGGWLSTDEGESGEALEGGGGSVGGV